MRTLRDLTLIGLAGILIPSVLAAQSEKTTMKAVVLHSYGGPEGAKLEEVPRPEPKEDEADVLEELARLMEAQKLTLVISQTFPLADFSKALDQIATRHTRGKIVLQVAAEPRS